jgi:hypothetical protein
LVVIGWSICIVFAFCIFNFLMFVKVLRAHIFLFSVD